MNTRWDTGAICCSLVLKFVGGLRSEIESHAASLSRVCRVGASSFLHRRNWANYSVHRSNRCAILPVLKPATRANLKKYRSILFYFIFLGAIYAIYAIYFGNIFVS